MSEKWILLVFCKLGHVGLNVLNIFQIYRNSSLCYRIIGFYNELFIEKRHNIMVIKTIKDRSKCICRVWTLELY